MRRWIERTSQALAWPCLVMAAALVPVSGLFTSDRIFHLRDLAAFFWPRHLWLRGTLQAGQWPLWDPHAAAGQAAFVDPLNHIFFLPALLLRLVPSEVLSFNLWVALPLPLGALGAWLLFRRRFSNPASALGALIFTYAGPVVSTTVYPNLSWSVALMPWVLWAVARVAERPCRATMLPLAAVVALQATAGEPVTLAATLVLAAALALAFSEAPMWRTAAAAGVGILGGVLLAAAQLIPLAMAASQSPRAGMRNDGLWSLHPLASLELFVPKVFGSSFDADISELPWLAAMNGDRDPLLYTLYMGIGALALSIAGARHDRGWSRFWVWTAVAGFIAALGEFSFPYRTLQSVVPVVESFRFPMKYLSVCALAAGALAASGWMAIWSAPGSAPVSLRSREAMVLGGVGVFALVLAAGVAVEPRLAWLAARVGIDDVGPAVEFLRASATPMLLRAAALAGICAVLLAIALSVHPRRTVAALLLAVLALVDPLVENRGLNSTMPAASLGEPAWVSVMRSRGEGRVYVGARMLAPGSRDRAVDGPAKVYMPGELSRMEAQTLMHSEYALTPSAWDIREVVSLDLPLLWPRPYGETLQMFSVVDKASRWRFLQRAGVRYCLVTDPFHESAVPMYESPDFDSFVLYDCNPGARRAFVTSAVAVEPDPRERLARLFDASLAPDTILLEAPPGAPAGQRGSPQPLSAEIVEETSTRLVVRASAGADGGHLVLLDSFNPDWHAAVDGEPAVIERANALFRAIPLAPGTHVVEFEYRPRALYLGAAVTLAALLGLVVPWPARLRAFASRLGPAASPIEARGFTLVELLIVIAVIAIIAAIAIPGLMRSRQAANEASAIGSIKAIFAAQTAYAAGCGWGGFAQALGDLGLAPPGGLPFLSEDVVGGSHSGYDFAVTAYAGATQVAAASATCNGSANASVTGYHASGVPIELGSTGQRSFATDARGTVYLDMSGAAIPNPIPADARPLE